MKHELPQLPYQENALEPVLSKETLEYHYGRHHRNYVDKVNQLIQGTEFENSDLEAIVLRSTGALFDNAGQTWNHTFYWNCLSPKRPELPTELQSVLEKDFGSIGEFKDRLIASASGVFGSGWAWLVQNPRSQILTVETTSNAENPMRFGRIPLLTLDVWEHAYYIDYRNERSKYLASIWQVINWDFVANNYNSAVKAAA